MRAVAACVLLIASSAAADGYYFKDGRFPEGSTTVLALTPQQKEVIALYMRCRNQKWSPFIFKLTKHQKAALERDTGLRLGLFAIYDSYGGDNGAESGYNYIVRFSEGEFEIPHKILIEESKRAEYETDVMGWSPSPLVDYEGSTCPE